PAQPRKGRLQARDVTRVQRFERAQHFVHTEPVQTECGVLPPRRLAPSMKSYTWCCLPRLSLYVTVCLESQTRSVKRPAIVTRASTRSLSRLRVEHVNHVQRS